MRVLVAIYSHTPAWTIPAARVDDLRARFPGIEFRHAGDHDSMVRLMAGAEIAFSSVLAPEAFAAADRLAWVHSPAAGVGRLLFPALVESPVVLTNSRGMNASAVAEHTFAMLLALVRRLPVAVRAQQDGRWAQDDLSGLPMLAGRTLGIVGLGAIGTALASLGRAFGMRVIATRRTAGGPCPPEVDRVLASTDLDQLLAAADVVVVAAPLTRETRDLIGASEFARMKPGGAFRQHRPGKLVRERDLVAALESGHLGGRPWTSSSASRWNLPTRCGRCRTSSSRRTSLGSGRTTGRLLSTCSRTTLAGSGAGTRCGTWWTKGENADRGRGPGTGSACSRCRRDGTAPIRGPRSPIPVFC